jgi:hypothetical protein
MTLGKCVRIESQNLANINDITAFRHPKYFGREGAFFLQEWVQGRLLGELVHDDRVPENQVII